MPTRIATLLDSLLLSSLSVDVQRMHAEQHPAVFKVPDNPEFAVSFFDGMLADPSVTIFIAEENAEAAGCIVCKLIERPETLFAFAARILLIDQISVRPDMRGRGIGVELMRQAEKLAAELQVQRIVLDSWDFNVNAHGFFESLGFSKFTFRFWKWLQEK